MYTYIASNWIECKLNPVSRVSTHNGHWQKGIPLNLDWPIDHERCEIAGSAWSSTDYRAGNLYLTCQQSLATCTYLGLLLRRKSAHIHKLVDNVEMAVVHSKVEGTPAKLH